MHKFIFKQHEAKPDHMQTVIERDSFKTNQSKLQVVRVIDSDENAWCMLDDQEGGKRVRAQSKHVQKPKMTTLTFKGDQDSYIDIDTEASRVEAKLEGNNRYKRDTGSPSMEVEEVENPVLPLDTIPESQERKNFQEISGRLNCELISLTSHVRT